MHSETKVKPRTSMCVTTIRHRDTQLNTGIFLMLTNCSSFLFPNTLHTHHSSAKSVCFKDDEQGPRSAATAMWQARV